MVNPAVVSALIGVSGLIAAICLLAYFFSLLRPERHIDDIRDLPKGVASALASLKDEKGRQTLLKKHIDSATQLLGVIYGQATPLDLNRQAAGDRALAARRYLLTAGLFAFLAFVGLIYSIATVAAVPTPSQDHAAQAQAAPATPVPAASAAAVAAPKYAWMPKRLGGTPYTVQVPVTSHNRHNEDKVGYSRTEFLNQVPELKGVEARIVSVDYTCSGVDNRCAWSQDGNGGHGKNVSIAADGQSFTWFRSWDGDPVNEVYTLHLEAYVCIENCRKA